MMDDEIVPIMKPQGHHCFACGTANPIGLNMQFYRAGDSVCSDVTLNRNYEGWENMAHGGIISALLDETMAWTIIFFKRVFFVTRKMEVKYIRPVPVDVPLRVKGTLEDASRPMILKAVAVLEDREGNLLARASGQFAELSRDRLSAVPEGLKRDMEELFESLS